MHPYLINTEFFKLPSYGVAMATAYVLAYLWIMKNFRKEYFDKNFIENSIFYSIVFGIVGAKIFYLATFWSSFGFDFYSRMKGLFSLDNLKAGFVFYGGFIGATSFLIYYCRAKKISFFRLADLFAPALALGHSIGRIGCFMAGCCHGGYTHMPWGVVFSSPYCQTDPHYMGVPIHPTQLYESLGNIAIFFILNYLYKKKTLKDGRIFLIYAMLYSFLRFINEFFRADNRGSFLYGFSQAQIISIVVIVSSLLFLASKGRKNV